MVDMLVAYCLIMVEERCVCSLTLFVNINSFLLRLPL